MIVAGDMCEVKNISPAMPQGGIRTQQSGNDFRRENIRNFITDELKKYKKVIMVMGNHEHYHFGFDKTLRELRERITQCGLTNVTVLENEYIEYEGVLFLGATMWTDCNKHDPITMQYLKSSMNDYNVITKYYKDKNVYHRLTTDATYQMHHETKRYFQQVLENNTGMPTVVITHHAPSTMSIPPQYKEDFHMNGGFASDLSEFILDHPQIKTWVHGHMHDPVDYMIGTTRILCNPRGYAGYEKRADEFNPSITFEITK